MQQLKIKVLIFLAFLVMYYSCLPPERNPCMDGVMNNDEIGIDCGGACAPCRTADISKELMITDTGVVNHPEASNGKLSFGHLMENYPLGI